MLYDPSRHEPLKNDAWSEAKAIQTANEIFDFICAGYVEDKFWPAHPDEDTEQPFNNSVYNGAAGTLWALTQLAKRLQRKLFLDPATAIAAIHKNYLEKPDTLSVVPSFLLGESGILSVAQVIAPSKYFSEMLEARILENSRNPVNEALWGCPGTMIAALRIGHVELFQNGADYLFEQWTQRDDGFWSWTQDMYGRVSQYTGAGHGFFGNVYALLEGQHLLTNSQRDLLYERTAAVAIGCALRENQKANWHPHFGDHPGRLPLVQWCHGAPGIITSLRSFPRNSSSELETVLEEAGELIWESGPLKKGIGICHGTDGNGYAFLRLFERTGHSQWIDRARSFAIHAIQQRNGRYSLWTGEAGLALFLLDCVDARSDFPTLDTL